MIFTERRRDTTWPHQIATAVLFTSPVLIYAAHPQKILDNPAVEMIKNVPSVWDETIVLPPSTIGEVAAMARRSGERWFLAVINGPTGRKIEIPLSFLGDGSYETSIVRDGSAPASVPMETRAARRTESLTIDLPEGGGYLARFYRK